MPTMDCHNNFGPQCHVSFSTTAWCLTKETAWLSAAHAGRRREYKLQNFQFLHDSSDKAGPQEVNSTLTWLHNAASAIPVFLQKNCQHRSSHLHCPALLCIQSKACTAAAGQWWGNAGIQSMWRTVKSVGASGCCWLLQFLSFWQGLVASSCNHPVVQHLLFRFLPREQRQLHGA
jgi:hypothetical protein